MAPRPAVLRLIPLAVCAFLLALLAPTVSPAAAQTNPAGDDTVHELGLAEGRRPPSPPSIAIGSDGVVRMASVTNKRRLAYTICSDAECSSYIETILGPKRVSSASLALDTDDRPVFAVSTYGESGPSLPVSSLQILRCLETDCSDQPTSIAVNPSNVVIDAASQPIVALVDDIPTIATQYRKNIGSRLTGYALLRCTTTDCSGSISSAKFPNRNPDMDRFSLDITRAGLPVFTTVTVTNSGGVGKVDFVRCGDVRCDESTSARLGFTKTNPLVALDGSDRPLMVFTKNNKTLMVKCRNEGCSRRGPARLIDLDAQPTDLALASDGTPTIVLEGNEFTDSHLVDCATVDCSEKPNRLTVDTVGYVDNPALVLDADNNPRIGFLARQGEIVKRNLRACVTACDSEQTIPELCRALDNANVIVGTQGKDRLVGTSGSDIIIGLGGNDVIQGAGGNDCIYPGRGANRVAGGPGNDLIDGYGSATQRFKGDAGDDVMFSSDGSENVLKGGAGDDTLFGRGWSSAIGGSGKDTCMARYGVLNRVRSCESQPTDVSETLVLINKAVDRWTAEANN